MSLCANDFEINFPTLQINPPVPNIALALKAGLTKSSPDFNDFLIPKKNQSAV